MSLKIGREFNIGIAYETERGTAPAEADYWLPVSEVDFDEVKEEVIEEAGYGVSEDSVASRIAKVFGTGKIGGSVYPSSFGLLLCALFGSETPSGTTPEYTHTYEFDTGHQHQSLALYSFDSGKELQFPLGCLSKLEISAEVGSFLKYSAEFLTQKSADSNATPSYTYEPAFLARHCKVYFADTYSGLAQAQPTSVNSIKLTIDKGLAPDDVLGNITPEDYLNQEIKIEGEIIFNYDDDTWRDVNFAEESYKALRIKVVDLDNPLIPVPAYSTDYPTLQFDLAKIRIMEWSKSNDLSEISKQTLKFKGMFSLGDTLSMTSILINSVATYPAGA